jgi:hypothetical protein
MENIDIKNANNLLKQFGIDLTKLDPIKLEKLMLLSDKIKDPSQITPEFMSEVVELLSINKNNLNKELISNSKSLKVKRNEKCLCGSGIKSKKCCFQN